MSSPEEMTMAQAKQALSALPQCALNVFLAAQQSSGCGTDQVCLCTNPNFLTTLQFALPTVCTFQEQDTALKVSGALCLKAVPALGESRQPLIIGVMTAITAAMLIAVALRFVSRKISNARWGQDDVWIIVATIFTLGLNMTSFVGLKYGSGLHTVRLGMADIVGWAKIYISFQLMFGASVTAIKLALLAFYHRIFPMKRFTNALIGLAIFLILWWAAHFFTVIFTCRPFAYNWNRSIKNGKCLNAIKFSYGISAIDVFTDMVVLILPIPWLLKLQLDMRKKLAITGIFLLGSFACVASIVRIPLLTELRVYDLPYTSVIAGLWINVECSIGIVSACLPVMRPLFQMAPSVPKSIKSKLTGYHRSTVRASEINTSGFSGKTLGSNSYPDTADKKGLPLPLNAASMGYQKNMGYHNQWPEPSLHSNETEGSGDVEALPVMGAAGAGNHNSAAYAMTNNNHHHSHGSHHSHHHSAQVPSRREDLEMGIIKETEVKVDSRKR